MVQGYPCEPVTVYQVQFNCMALVERGRSGAERTRHSDKRLLAEETAGKGEAKVKHAGRAVCI